MPDVKVCRGCGGTGLDHHLSARELQLAKRPFYMHRSRSGLMRLMVSDAEARARLSYHAPLALVQAEVQRRHADGWTLREEDQQLGWLFAWGEVRCEWCHGTGKPALSVQTLEIGARNGG